MKQLFTILFLSFITTLSAQQGEVLTNQTIIQLHSAGLGEDVLTAKINSSTCAFDLSTEGLIALKKAAVPDAVITAMLAKGTPPLIAPAVTTYPKTSGIYYYDSTLKEYANLEPSVLTNEKSGGLGESLKRSVTGLFNAKLRASLSGKQAAQIFHTVAPSFLFVFDSTATGFANSNTYLGSAQSPNEFFLVKFTVSKKSREVVVGKENNLKSDIGIDDDVKISFTAKKLRKGVYEVTTTTPLRQGEYCFMFSASSMYAGQTHKVYDFSVMAQ